MRISVIVPVYNTELYLHRCIDRILSQSFTDFELLLIDDGSTDGSGTICEEYAEKDGRVHVFHKENAGASSARNLGLQKAKGEWVTFVDSDDWIEENYFQLDFEQDVDLYVHNGSFADGNLMDSLPSQYIDASNYTSFLQKKICLHTFRTVWGFFFKKKIISENGLRFDSRFSLGEDTLFVMDYYRFARSIQIMDNSCYIYNQRENWEGKYKLSWKEVDAYLESFVEKYKMLHIESQLLLVFMFNFFKERIKDDEKHVGLKWSLSTPVLFYKKTQLPNRGFSYRAKYYLARVASSVINQGNGC